ncbi:hypothetical protein PILCRDRAFT_813163 [Piloderma croceum F 1598]|uniref:Uncharacterized protein n=1 Tax=Piloderma croceum (strain F 1598) TaxID=765440 RepID=A0A0C3GF06_PILCF|nr:hypothetical protein PILCRDRAFT_813163 [Piloderma croceum F 1598]
MLPYIDVACGTIFLSTPIYLLQADHESPNSNGRILGRYIAGIEAASDESDGLE